MATTPDVPVTDDATRSPRLDAATVMSTLRIIVGAGSWASPRLSWRTFGLGLMSDDPRPVLATRLFGVRDLALGLAVRHPNPEVRRAALQIGVAVDAVDVVASLLSIRKGAPKASLLLVGGGAAFFVALGLAALADGQPRPSASPQVEVLG